MSDVTQILARIEAGEHQASSQLLPIVYDELRQLAAARLQYEKPGQTLQATALVHEAYLRLAGNQQAASWDNRGHFFSAAAEAMRRILIERARKHQRIRHGGKLARVDLDQCLTIADSREVDLLSLDAALEQLEMVKESYAQVVKFRYFAGLTVSETAKVMDVSVSTVERHWRFAKAWLLAEITRSSSGPRQQ